MAFELPSLPYGYDALEPYVDAQTMRIHHDKHHQTYVDKLNAALEKHPALQKKAVEELLSDLAAIPEEIRTAVRNFGGGHFNHLFFWQMMAPKVESGPEGKVAEAIKKDFGGLEEFKKQFSDKAATLFGSGWVWLAKDSSGKLGIVTTPNQDSPISVGLKPLLVLDVWEHAYYLKYQNRRPEYIENWWNLVNWEKIEKLFISGKE